MTTNNDVNENLLCGGEDISALVVDLGFSTSKIGHNQEDTPRIFLNSICGECIFEEGVMGINGGANNDNVICSNGIGNAHGSNSSSSSRSGRRERSERSGTVGLPGIGGRGRSRKRGINDLMFPLNLYNRKEHVRVKPLFCRDQYNNVSLNSDVFEKMLEYAIEGVEVQRVYECTDEVIDSIKLGGLNLNFEEHPMLLSESNIHHNKIREEMTEILFEKYNIPALYFAKKAKLTSFSLGRSHSLVIDIGFSSLDINPVYEGYVLQKNSLEYNIGGNYFDKLIYETLKKDHINIIPYFCTSYNKYNISSDLFKNIHSSYREEAILDIVRYMKETVCRIRVDNDTNLGTNGANATTKSSAIATSSTNAHSSTNIANIINNSSLNANASDLIMAAGSANASSNGNIAEEKGNEKTRNYDLNDPLKEEYFELPDGCKINIDKYKYDIGECLFKSIPLENNFKGLPQSIINCILSSDVDIRKDLLHSIIVTGGSSSFPGLIERLYNSLKEKECFTQSIKLKILNMTSYVENKYSSWLGGSILASLGTFQQLWVSKREYLDSGHKLIFDRCF
ncbi:actin-related protein, putative [Plasmodium malariae]|uniref:Actin-related protein, putative n=1 Tax=Plasmodium malariae TaxID=5858 RepID=A0A1C3KF74_PLAMA|nr:actin-related protein, putative [Plasmodium malariae]SBT72284.1 actin-related protein, putative [Plasmodium malariae]